MTKIEELIYCWENANPLPEIDDGFMLSIYRSQDKIKKLQQENERLNNIINELEKWIDEYYKSNRKWYNTELSSHDMRYYQREYINTEAMLVKFDRKLKELKESNNDE